jgi:hypothetical protein
MNPIVKSWSPGGVLIEHRNRLRGAAELYWRQQEVKQDKDIAQSMEIKPKTVALWRQRFFKEGPDCLWEVAAGRGRKPRFSADKVEGIIRAALQSRH